MNSVSTTPQDPGPGRIAFWSAIAGLLLTLMVAVASGRLLLNERAGHATTFGALGFSVALTAPIMVALASFLVTDLELRRSNWLAAALFALGIGGLTIFSGVGLLIGAAGVGLLAAWWLAKGWSGTVLSARAMVVTAWLLLWFGAAQSRALDALHPDVLGRLRVGRGKDALRMHSRHR